MNIDEEIMRTRERLEREMRAADIKRRLAEDMTRAFSTWKLNEHSPVKTTVPSELQPIINETISRMDFSSPKIVKRVPDGRIMTRRVISTPERREFQDAYSFDVVVQSGGSGKDAWTREIWIFKDNTMAIVQNNCNLTWTTLKGYGIDVMQVRSKIIETIAQKTIRSNANSYGTSSYSRTTKTSSGGCYVATAIYGSYDCPEVWLLRRYRDFSLQQSVLGRLFIKVYYKISPIFVKYFGNNRIFKSVGKFVLDKIVNLLRNKGYSDGCYYDR